MSVLVGLQSRRTNKCMRKCVGCVYCFACGSDALASRAMRQHHETPNACLPVESVEC